MTKEIKRLRMVEEVFASRENAVARQLNEFQVVLQQAESQLTALREYRDEYSQPLPDDGATDLSRLQNQGQFMRRLDDTIRHQERVVAQARENCESLRKQYGACRTRTNAVKKVCNKRSSRQRLADDRAEQKELDAHNLQLARR